MIEFFSKWIEGIAITVVIASIFEMIIPNGNTKKYIKMVLGFFVVFSIIMPFVNSNGLNLQKFEKEFENYTINENTTNIDKSKSQKDLNEIYIQTLEEEIKKTIETQGYEVYKCDVKGNFDTDNEKAGITSINIILDFKKENKEYFEEKNVSEKGIQIQDVDEIQKVEIKIGKKKEISQNTQEITLQDIVNLKKYLSEHYELDKSIINITKR